MQYITIYAPLVIIRIEKTNLWYLIDNKSQSSENILLFSLPTNCHNLMHNQHRLLRLLQLIATLREQHPKSIQQLRDLLETTERSVYRYLDLLREAGFELEKDFEGRYFIFGGQSVQPEGFTPEEARFIKGLVLGAGKRNTLKDAILKKIYLNSEAKIQTQHIQYAHLGKIIRHLQDAMDRKLQVTLVKYQSAHSQSISDRNIEPIHFTDNYQSVFGYETRTGENKLFNIERISAVRILDKSMRYTDRHTKIKIDAFGFADKGKRYPVKLKLNLRASLIMREEYPATVPYMQTSKDKQHYILGMEVFDLRPVQRFVSGLPGDAEFIT
jgi:proteasome accessory factor C